MTQTQTSDRIAIRNTFILSSAQAILGAQLPVNFVLGGLVGQTLAPSACLATLPLSMIVFCSMLSAQPMSRIMQVWGRKMGFFLGVMAGALGGLICCIAIYERSFALMLCGCGFTGIYMSAHGFYRFAATDMASEKFRPKAISIVMAGGLLAAIIGPQMVKLFMDSLAPIPFAGAYLAVFFLNIIGGLMFFFLHIPRPQKTAKSGDGRSLWEMLKTPKIVVAILCAMVSYSLMNLVMTSTPLAVVGCGFETNDAANVVSIHVLSMYFPSFFTGHLIVRFGAEKIVGAGLAILMGAGIVGLSGVDLMDFYLALALLGVGWNFGFIGATSMLASAHSPSERGRIQGFNDFAVFGMVTIASLASGGLMNCSGGDPVAGWQAVNYAMIPFLIIAGSSLLILVFKKTETPA
ncbi:MAG: MFS transporter [Alphaproteobacteria bacterium]|nr:MFS transporter [Alphaproteobacteria bacterium]